MINLRFHLNYFWDEDEKLEIYFFRGSCSCGEMANIDI